MKYMCEDHVNNFYSAGKPAEGEKLKNVAHTFSILQQRRHTADYDVSFYWTQTNAIGQVDLASAAFDDWRSICETVQAQDFVLGLLFPKAADKLKSSADVRF